MGYDLNLRLIAIDPGEKHCGYAFFMGGQCRLSQTLEPARMLAVLETDLRTGRVDMVVVEEFRVYDDVPITWSDCRTIEVIGVVVWLCARYGVEVARQPAHLKKPTAGHVRHRNVSLIGNSVHARDAELHGYYRLWAPSA